MSDTKISFVGEVNVSKIDLISTNGYATDITNLVVETNVYEDMFSNSISATLVIADATNLSEVLPIVGEEIVEIEFTTPTLQQKFIKTFYVYKISDRNLSEASRAQTYVMHLCSKELIISENNKISKAFSGKISTTVSNIFSDKEFIGSDKKLIVEDTSNSYSFVAPYWTPFKTINWLSERAMNKTGTPNYVFFETTQSFEFTSIERLMKSPPKRSYVYADVNATTLFNDIDSKYNVVDNIYADVSFDYLRRLNSGMYSSSLQTLDMTSKTIKAYDYDYIKNFSNSTHLEKNPISTPNIIRKKIASQYFIEKNGHLYSNKMDQGHDKRYLQRNSLMEQVFAYRVNISVPGRFDIKAGDVIDFTINSFGAFGSEEMHQITDNKYTGKYLITAIRHIIRSNKHTMNLEIIKDSFAKPLGSK